MRNFTFVKVLLICLALAGICGTGLAQLKEEYTVVLGSRETYGDAEVLLKIMIKKGVAAVVYKSTAAGNTRYRVCSGRHASITEANRIKDKLIAQLGQTDFWVMKLDAGHSAVPPSGAAPALPPVVANPTPKPNTPTTKPDSQATKPVVKSTKVLADTSNFGEAFLSITHLMVTDKRMEMDAYVHPVHGLYLIYNPGAHVVAERVLSYQDIFASGLLATDNGLKVYLSNLKRYANETPVFANLPVYDCKTKTYEKAGCYCSTLADQDKMIRRLLSSQKEFVTGTGLTAAEKNTAEAADQYMKIAALNTGSTMVQLLYFSHIEGRWYLSAIDLTNPCGN